MLVVGSGKSTVADTPASNKPNASVLPTKTFTFVSDKPSFPGTIVAGVFQEYKSDDAGMDLHVFFQAHASELFRRLTPRPRFRNSPTSSRCMACRLRRS
jgi:hypothetical protein